MPKIITSPVAKFPGTITLCDPLTLAQCQSIEAAFGDPNFSPDGKRVWLTAVDTSALAALIACSEEWHIQGQPEHPTAETFIASPRGPTHELIAWAFKELQQIYFGELAVPNA